MQHGAEISPYPFTIGIIQIPIEIHSRLWLSVATINA